MRFLLFIIIATIPFFPGKPADEATVILENANGSEMIAFQRTGEKGKVSFKHLNAGTFSIVIEFPQQEGKWIKTKRRFNTLTKASYNPQNKTYFYQGAEGFFSIKIENTRRIDPNTFNPVFREIRSEKGNPINVLQFQARNRGAKISLKIKALTAAQYKRLTNKTKSTVSTISIPGAR